MSARARSTTGLPLKAPSGTVAPLWFVHFGLREALAGGAGASIVMASCRERPLARRRKQERGCGRGEEQAMSLGAPRAAKAEVVGGVIGP